MHSGRKVKSIEQRRSEGGNEARLPIMVSGRPTTEELLTTPPDGLSRWALAVWEEVVPQLAGAGLIDRVDRGLLESYCRALGRSREIGDFLEWEEDTGTGERKPRSVHSRLLAVTNRGAWTSNPLLSQERDYAKEARLAGELLGLNPVGRARLKPKTAPKGAGLKSLTADLPEPTPIRRSARANTG